MAGSRDRQYTNGEITVFWKPSKCIHATTCFRELLEVFNPGKRPWVNMQGAPSRRIIETVNKCPTQALEWKRNEDLSEAERAAQFDPGQEELTPQTIAQRGEIPASQRDKSSDSQKGEATAFQNNESSDSRKDNAPTGATEIRIMPDGPIVAEGDFRIRDAEGSLLKPVPLTSFCRCGQSRSMPYCDGTHRKAGFSG